jgi:DNA modification methylase
LTLVQQQQQKKNGRNKIIQGDALTELSKLNSESVDCCITSPPYWALRDYKVDGQLGLEPTIDEYIHKLATIFDQVKRVLKKTGTCWVVIGDTYGGGRGEPGITTGQGGTFTQIKDGWYSRKAIHGMTKSLCLIPERFAISMINNGWILRNKIIWYKPNCMPSSAKDRFTIDWEYVYFFTKSQKYFFETQYEPIQETTLERDKYLRGGGKNALYTDDTRFYAAGSSRTRIKEPRMFDHSNTLGRIKRAVWKISTKPFSSAHFAVFPPDLVLPMLKAGCPSPDGLVLDPFLGAGTTGLVALQNARRFIGIELNPEYVKLAQDRLRPFMEVPPLTVYNQIDA